MTECDTDTPIEHVLSLEDAVSFSILLIILFYKAPSPLTGKKRKKIRTMRVKKSCSA